MKKRLDKLSEEDFAVLNGPLESGRQSPEGLAGGLLLAPFLIGLVLVVGNMFVFMDRRVPAHPTVIVICLLIDIVGLITIILSFVFSAKKVYEKRQSAQYLIVTWVSQFFFGGLLYWVAVYMIFDDVQFHHDIDVSGVRMTSFIMISISLGIALFLFTFLRFINKLEEGKFRKNTKRDEVRGYLEERTMDLKAIAIRFGIAFSLISTSLFTMLHVTNLEMLIFVSIAITLFYVMTCILPEQLVIWYCIKRFKSFQFSEES